MRPKSSSHFNLKLLAVCLAAMSVATGLPSLAETRPLADNKVPEESIALNKSIPLGNSAVTARVSIMSFKIGQKEYSSWCYRTSGMQDLKQPELFVLVPKKSTEKDTDFPLGPIKFLAGLVRPARPEAWNQLDFAKYNCFPGSPFAGMMFVPFDGLKGIDVAPGSLAAVAITESEFDVARLAGSTRVKAALAHQARYYPCPIWCDRERKSTFSDADLADMKTEPPLANLPPVGSFASILLADRQLSLRITKEEAKLIERSLSKYNGMARLSLTFDPRAGSFLVWVPKDAKTQPAVGADVGNANKVSGEFLAIIGGAKKNSTSRISDGFLLTLEEAEFKNFQTALAEGQDYKKAMADGPAKSFSIEWVQTDYFNPVENKTYHAPQGWEAYDGKGKATNVMPPHNKKAVAVHHIVLLSADEDFRKATTVDALALYTKLICDTAVMQLGTMHPTKQQQVLIQCNLSPGNKVEFKVALNPSEDGIEPKVKDLYTALNCIEGMSVKYPVAFQILVDVPASHQ